MRQSLAAMALGAAALLGPAAWGVSVQSWTASTGDAFSRGILDGTSVDEEGRVRLAPALETLWGPEEGVVWAVRPLGDGALVALSAPGRLVYVEAGRPPEVWYRAEEESLVTSLSPDGAGGVYFALSPEGRLLHATGPRDAEIVVDTGAMFIWALETVPGGALWIGTGVPGSLFRYDRGALEKMLDLEDDPVRCIATLPAGGVVLGTGSKGRVIRIGKDERPFVLLDAEEEEIVSIVAHGDGTIFALAARGARPPVPPAVRGTETPATVTETVRVTATPGPEAAAIPEAPEARTLPSRARLPTLGGAVVYRLDADGGSRKIWEGPTEVPFALLGRDDGRLLVATGDAGKLFLLDGEGRSSILLRVPSDQASAMARGGDPWILVAGTTDARVERVGPRPGNSGSYLTPLIDAGTVADWGKLSWEADVPRGSSVQVRARAGNTADPDITWSDWVQVGSGSRTEVDSRVPPARWFQARIELRPSSDGQSPALRLLEVLYLPRNRRPVVSGLTVESPGVVWSRGPAPALRPVGPVVTEDPLARRVSSGFEAGGHRLSPVRKSFEVGARTFSWQAQDPDGDPITYRLEIRREDDERWLLLATDVDDDFLSWDARGMPDGTYRVRVSAADAAGNLLGKGLVADRTSDLFRIDNTPPTLAKPEIRRKSDGVEIAFVARDPAGRIAAVETAVDGSDWKQVDSLDGVADSTEEQYLLNLGTTDRSVRVRVIDASGNLGGDLWILD